MWGGDGDGVVREIGRETGRCWGAKEDTYIPKLLLFLCTIREARTASLMVLACGFFSTCFRRSCNSPNEDWLPSPGLTDKDL